MTSRFRAALRTAVALLATVLGLPVYGQDAAPAGAATAAANPLTPPKLASSTRTIRRPPRQRACRPTSTSR